MKLTLLIDLDDTLLGNKMETFIPAYLAALGSHLTEFVSPEKLVETMLNGTQCMFNNTRPDRTLKSCFDHCFFPGLGMSEGELIEHFNKFYNEEFPNLRGLTQFRPEAVTLIQRAFSRGYQVGIGTNPAFPLTAIIQRLEWAGLSPQEFDFQLIPSYETFHFTKPNPAYFTEFLTSIGWPNNPVIMIGNDPDHDVLGSNELGIPVFWISNGIDKYPSDKPSPNGSGSLDDVIPWLDQQSVDDMQPDYSSISASKAILRGSPAGLSTILSNISEAIWMLKSQENEWSLTEIVCHLRDVEIEINIPRIKTILSEEDPFIPGVDSDSWAYERDYFDQDGLEAFKTFVAARVETLDLLDKLGNNDWSRPVRHAIFGPTDLREIVRIMAGHDQLHDRQIYKAIPK